MNYKLKYAKEALNDLDSIFAFVSNVSTSGAKTVINKIRAKINKLTFMPSGLNFDARLGRKLHDTYKIEAIISDNYIILFVVDEEKKVVIITHIIPSNFLDCYASL